MREPQILATSGGMRAGRTADGWRLGGLLRYALALSGAARPRLCFVHTARGDDDASVRVGYVAAAADGVTATHLALFPMPNVGNVRAHLLAQDVIWVGGGSVANLLAVWRAHGLDVVMREAWEAGIVLGGSSAGSLCWHVGGTTDSFGPELRPVTNGLALLPYGNGVHHDSEDQRRPLLNRLVAAGTLPRSYATEDGTGLHYVGTEMREAVSDLPGKAAWRIEADGSGGTTEVRLPTRLLDL